MNSIISKRGAMRNDTVSMRWDLVSFFTFIFRHSSCLEFDDIKKYLSRKEEKSLKYFTSFLNFIFPVYSSSFECYIIIIIIGMKKKKIVDVFYFFQN